MTAELEKQEADLATWIKADQVRLGKVVEEIERLEARRGELLAAFHYGDGLSAPEQAELQDVGSELEALRAEQITVSARLPAGARRLEVLRQAVHGERLKREQTGLEKLIQSYLRTVLERLDAEELLQRARDNEDKARERARKAGWTVRGLGGKPEGVPAFLGSRVGVRAQIEALLAEKR